MINYLRIFPTLLIAVALLASACGLSSAQSTESSESTDTFEAFGNRDASRVIVVAQGGPMPELVMEEARDIFSDIDLDDSYVVVPHQAQTLNPGRFINEEISFDEAKEFDTETTAMLADVVKGYVDDGRDVVVVGISFGAFVVQVLLATQGNIADGYFIQVGRLDMPDEVWEPFSEGRFVGFIDGVEVVDFDADGAGMGGDGDFTDANMAKLAAGLGHKRYTELLADTVLSNVVYAYGLVDEQVGRLTADELAFLESKNVNVLRTENDHGGTIEETINRGLSYLGDAVPPDQ